MGLEYIQLFSDMEALFEPYDDAQRGRLVMAMMAYAYRGEDPQFTGVEKFIWPVLRQHIDRCAANVEAKKSAGSKGGKSAKPDKQEKQADPESKHTEAGASASKQTQAQESESKQNEYIQDHEQDHEQDHDHDHEQEKKKGNGARTRANTSATASQEPVIGIDGTDLSESIWLNEEVDALLRKYKISEALRDDLLDDIGKHGLDKVKRVMHDAAQSDTKGGLSIKFIRACLASDGKPKPSARFSSGKASMQRYSPDERKDTYTKAVVDLDAAM